MSNITELGAGLILLAIIIPILLYKRKRQIGKAWEGTLPGKVKINNIPLNCIHCKSDVFVKREALIPTTFISLFRIPFLNQSGSAYVCKACGQIHWFSRPQETSVEMVYEESND
jgi:hypothetical protein